MSSLNLNQVIIGGHLTDHPELRKTETDKSVTSFSVAVNRLDANKEKAVDFIDVVAWGKSAEFVCRYFQKGSGICVVGRLQKRKYTDKNGIDRYITEVVAREINFVDSKSEKNQGASDSQMFPPDDYNSADIGPDDDLPF